MEKIASAHLSPYPRATARHRKLRHEQQRQKKFVGMSCFEFMHLLVLNKRELL